jgi:hypothetical protein
MPIALKFWHEPSWFCIWGEKMIGCLIQALFWLEWAGAANLKWLWPLRLVLNELRLAE